MAMQSVQTLHGSSLTPSRQLTAFASILDMDVLPTPLGPAEEVGMGYPAALDRVLQGRDDVGLADHVFESSSVSIVVQ